MKKTFKLCAAILVLLFSVCTAAWAGNQEARFGMASFSALPTLHEGRVKPLESAARAELRRIAGAERAGRLPARAWLAEALFDPARAAQRRLFRVRNPETLHLLELDGRGTGPFSLDDLSAGLDATQGEIPALAALKPADLTPAQRELLDVHARAFAFTQIAGSLSLMLPLNGVSPGTAGLPAGAFAEGPTWLELMKQDESLEDRVRKIVRHKGENPDRYTPEEKALALAGLQAAILRGTGENNTWLRIVPPQWNGDREWLSPWQAVQGGKGAPESAAYLSLWQDMAKAYRSGDVAAWREKSEAAQKTALALAGKGTSKDRLVLELAYGRLAPLFWAQVMYGAALGALLLRFYRSGWGLAGAGAVLHAAGLGMRIVILERPPVGTLYESLLYVAFAALLAALFAEGWRKRGGSGGAALAAGVALSLLLLLAAPVFAPEGDSMEVLVAVLNTNFWLATHVLCIASGYGVAMLAAVMAHQALWRRRPEGAQGVHKVLLAALFLTGLGTMLGGIWADQSWGRFWGWDPKENGALLIVLWIAWVLHGRWGGHLRPVAFLAAAAFLNVVVALSWFGVNLLGIGLHSYGFTSGMAWGLFAFCALESAVIAFLAFRSGKAVPCGA